MGWTIARLSEAHDCRRFRCGEHTLDSYLKRHAMANDLAGLGSTYAAVEDGTQRVLGYVTLCASAIHFQHVPAHSLPRYPIPAVLIARLAVDRSVQKDGIGTHLMLYALRLVESVADRLAVFAVTVDALTPGAKSWYQSRFGFTELLDDPLHLFVTIADLRASGLAG